LKKVFQVTSQSAALLRGTEPDLIADDWSSN